MKIDKERKEQIEKDLTEIENNVRFVKKIDKISKN